VRRPELKPSWAEKAGRRGTIRNAQRAQARVSAGEPSEEKMRKASRAGVGEAFTRMMGIRTKNTLAREYPDRFRGAGVVGCQREIISKHGKGRQRHQVTIQRKKVQLGEAKIRGGPKKKH